jgi:pimeloyl-ACP methyl ester carboxylesterase
MTVQNAATGYRDTHAAMLRHWPTGTRTVAVPTAFGPAQVIDVGPADADAVVLLPQGGASAVSWHVVAVALVAAGRRVYAVDQPGAGQVDQSGFPRNAGQLTAWLGEVLDGPGLDRTDLCGHSFGAWAALAATLELPQRVRRLALVDPTDAFVGLSLTYRLRAVPLLLRPGPDRQEAFLRWETGGRDLDPDDLALARAAAALAGELVEFLS